MYYKYIRADTLYAYNMQHIGLTTHFNLKTLMYNLYMFHNVCLGPKANDDDK